MNVGRDLENLKRLLRDVLILLPADISENEPPRAESLFKDICDLVFNDDDFYLRIWDESALNQLAKLFEHKSPNKDLYKEEIRKLSERKHLVHNINELFFSILSNEFSVEGVISKRV